ncbi:hypothetical protein PGB28_01720 [Primorskyibacter aestuariivivens]|uniref:hypothetical protein n=1 Tax=Primorskyibacter aestuariivivens TaxID=1888912 RepID=UPI0023017EB8|nr:hypothetical protein [Primorskyibacter aestuariivivens]MDA7427159.1 hypothetical protein [Primorskyibacter aestuariivivens]
MAVQTACPKPERRWMSSTGYLPSVAECLHGAEAQTPDARRIALVQDIHIKATAYNWLNKLTFWVAVALALTVLVWPSYVAIKAGRAENAKAKAEAEGKDAPSTHWSQRSATTAAIQTTVAALAALSFAFYAHYKGNQVVAENLMREIIFAAPLDEDRVAEILSAIADMDKGFGFTTVEALGGK